MNNLKFRVWMNSPYPHCVGFKSWWLSLSDGDWELNDLFVKENFPDYTIQQFTGVKDKNGTEIYEGDIVAFVDSNDFDSNENHLAGRIEWGRYGDGCFEEYVEGVECWMVAPYHLPLSTIINGGVQYGRGRATNGEPCVVIGNIFENPDLVKLIDQKSKNNDDE